MVRRAIPKFNNIEFDGSTAIPMTAELNDHWNVAWRADGKPFSITVDAAGYVRAVVIARTFKLRLINGCESSTTLYLSRCNRQLGHLELTGDQAVDDYISSLTAIVDDLVVNYVGL